MQNYYKKKVIILVTVSRDTGLHGVFMLMSMKYRSFIIKDLKNIKSVKGCRDGMPKSMQTR